MEEMMVKENYNLKALESLKKKKDFKNVLF